MGLSSKPVLFLTNAAFTPHITFRSLCPQEDQSSELLLGPRFHEARPDSTPTRDGPVSLAPSAGTAVIARVPSHLSSSEPLFPGPPTRQEPIYRSWRPLTPARNPPAMADTEAVAMAASGEEVFGINLDSTSVQASAPRETGIRRGGKSRNCPNSHGFGSLVVMPSAGRRDDTARHRNVHLGGWEPSGRRIDSVSNLAGVARAKRRRDNKVSRLVRPCSTAGHKFRGPIVDIDKCCCS
ncbi:unnamed protein product [Protopolystoma xenopodis]|uniref:Uncharacterized protein n=1 Tax=Protopolystoma xenopodis TaxID=117903 RepID=A0A3S4ZZT3_9PLAT|nr:unnamed protein product [Protopolystoma xenopodis]